MVIVESFLLLEDEELRGIVPSFATGFDLSRDTLLRAGGLIDLLDDSSKSQSSLDKVREKLSAALSRIPLDKTEEEIGVFPLIRRSLSCIASVRRLLGCPGSVLVMCVFVFSIEPLFRSSQRDLYAFPEMTRGLH